MSMQTYFGFGLLVECGKALTLEYPEAAEEVTLFGGEQKLVSASLSYTFVLE